METLELPEEERVKVGDLINEVARRAAQVGANSCEWPGLTFYRFTSPVEPHWDDVRSLSLGVVLQGRKRVRIGEQAYDYDPLQYLVLTRGTRFTAEILEASPEKPFLSFVLQIEPVVVRQVSADMAERTMTVFQRPLPPPPTAYVSPVDLNFVGAALRFFRSMRSTPDRRVLAPIYLKEIVYRLLQAEQCTQLLEAAAHESTSNPITVAISYIRKNLSQPVTVGDLAEQVALSPSAFAHLFKEVTGMSPYQFVKNVRLDQARTMLVGTDVCVSDAARAVGYSNVSHFINEFKRHFGVTPRVYAQAHRTGIPVQATAT